MLAGLVSSEGCEREPVPGPCAGLVDGCLLPPADHRPSTHISGSKFPLFNDRNPPLLLPFHLGPPLSRVYEGFSLLLKCPPNFYFRQKLVYFVELAKEFGKKILEAVTWTNGSQSMGSEQKHRYYPATCHRCKVSEPPKPLGTRPLGDTDVHSGLRAPGLRQLCCTAGWG